MNVERLWGASAAIGGSCTTPKGGGKGGGEGTFLGRRRGQGQGSKHPRLVHPLKGVGGYTHIYYTASLEHDLVTIYVF